MNNLANNYINSTATASTEPSQLWWALPPPAHEALQVVDFT